MSGNGDAGRGHRARLSEYLDGELAGRDRQVVEGHLATCGDCRLALEELAAVRARARSLEDRPPERNLWPGIRDALEGAAVIELAEHLPGSEARPVPARRRRVVLSLPQVGAAAAALVVLAAAGAWGVARTMTAPAPPPGGAASFPVSPRAMDGPGPVASFDSEVAELQEILRSGRDRLSPGTVRILEKNLVLIDAAIRESEEALALDPGNPFVERHLQRSVERKAAYLREAAALLETTD